MSEEMMEPVVTIAWDKAEHGSYKATMTVSGLPSEQMARAAVEHMQRLFCGSPQPTSQ